MKGTEQAESLTEALTGSLGSGLFGRLAWLARPDGVAGQDPKLILHPGTQVYYRSRQLPASDGLRNWQKKIKNTQWHDNHFPADTSAKSSTGECNLAKTLEREKVVELFHHAVSAQLHSIPCHGGRSRQRKVATGSPGPSFMNLFFQFLSTADCERPSARRPDRPSR